MSFIAAGIILIMVSVFAISPNDDINEYEKRTNAYGKHFEMVAEGDINHE